MGKNTFAQGTMKTLITLSIAILALIFSAGTTFAKEEASKPSAKLEAKVKQEIPDNRAKILESYLNQTKSPLAPYAKDFVKSADKYNLDWKLVAAISGLESSFGQHIPYNSYNGWGWGVYGDNVIRFKSWDEGIEVISKGLRERYLRERMESDPYIIGPTYASSPTWAQRVSFFMASIEAYKIRNARSGLALAL